MGDPDRGRRGRICLYAPNLFPVMGRTDVEFAGGAEVQQALLARGLVAEGFEVVIVTCDFGQPRRVVVDGVELVRSYPLQAGLPVLRFFHPRLTLATRALMEADAQVYFVQGGDLGAGLTHDVARLRGARFVFLAAHDYDVMRSLPFLRNPRDRWWYRRALRGADLRLAQTEYQQRTLRQEFGLDSEVVTNPVEIPAESVDAGQDGAVVWLATYKPLKRPEWFVEVARRNPGHRFVMCGSIPPPPLTRECWDATVAAARDCPNLEVRGYLDHSRLHELFARASLFVHTSPAEGFPNTVLEAWAAGLPTITGVDPDGIIAREGLGELASTVEGFADAVRRWMADPEKRRARGAAARAHVSRAHSMIAVRKRLAGLLDGVLAGARR